MRLSNFFNNFKLKLIFGLSLIFLKTFTQDSSICQELKIENVNFYALKDSASNERTLRNGVLVMRPQAKATVLVLHGFTRDKCDAAPLRLLLKNYNIFSFDFRAHGEQVSGQYSTMGYDEVYDVFAAVDYIRSRPELRDKPLYVMAFSMGAATAIEAQSIDGNLFGAMFLDTPFHSSAQVIKNAISRMRFKLFGYEFGLPFRKYLEEYAFNQYFQLILKQLIKVLVAFDSTKIQTFMKPISPVESITKINIPCMFVVCAKDKIVPYQDVVQIYQNHPGASQIWIADGRGHCDGLYGNPEFYDQLLNNFFDSVINNQVDKTKKIIRSCV
jgi:pimeloyl-ACP methyl ester carboxylesterase